MSLRISATTVESFHLYRTTEWMTEKRFVEGLTTFKPTPQIRRGIAMEKIIRSPQRHLHGHDYEEDGIVFPGALVETALAHIPERMVWQAKASKVYTVEGEPVTVVTKTDGQVGRCVIEIKTTENFEMERYQGSRQWRFYLDVFGADACRYVVYVIRESRRDGDLYMAGAPEVFELYPYDGMFSDVMDDLRALVSFIRLRGLERHFQPREEDALA